MVAFDGGSITIAPSAVQVEIVGALATDMSLAHMLLPQKRVISNWNGLCDEESTYVK